MKREYIDGGDRVKQYQDSILVTIYSVKAGKKVDISRYNMEVK